VSEIPQGIELQDRFIPFKDIHRLFSRTEYGKRLASQIRFAPYKPSAVSNTEWERALGADVNGLKHAWETYKLTQRFLALTLQAGSELSKHDMELLQLAAVTHDWQEGVEEVGDVLDMKKTEDMHRKEMEVLRSVIPKVIEDIGLAARLQEALDEVLIDRQSRLGAMFRTIERVGYLLTGMRAWKKGSVIKGSYQQQFRYLAVQVFSHQVPKLLTAVSSFIPVIYFLRKHEEALSQIAALPDDEFRFFPPEGIDREAAHDWELWDRFLEARGAWERRVLPEVSFTDED
jgi:hypothetical protein